MPASENRNRGRAGRPNTAIFWIGIGLAPLAALLVLLSNGTQALRVAALLAILAVVLIGLSIMLRPDAASVREEIEDSVFEELDGLRGAVRDDITSAARATHNSLSEKLQNMYEHVEALRGQLDAMREPYESRSAAGTSSGSHTGRAPVSPAPRPVGTAMVGGGVVPHTETVQVTTRQTIVDPQGDRGRVYGTDSRYRHRGEAATSAGHRRAEPEERADRGAPREESWTEQRLRDRLRDTGSHLFGDPGRFAASGPTGYATGNGYEAGHREGYEREDYDRGFRSHGRAEPQVDDVAADPRWSDLRAGDRWAAVRSDDRGRELRMGERRAVVHNDGSGTELRIMDRWAAVRREEERRSREPALEPDRLGGASERPETRRERREREERWAGGEAEARWSDGEAFRARHTGGQ